MNEKTNEWADIGAIADIAANAMQDVFDDLAEKLSIPLAEKFRELEMSVGFLADEEDDDGNELLDLRIEVTAPYNPSLDIDIIKGGLTDLIERTVEDDDYPMVARTLRAIADRIDPKR